MRRLRQRARLPSCSLPCVRQVIVTGPQPPSGRLFCVVCAMDFRAAAEQAQAAMIREMAVQPDGPPAYVRLRDPDALEPQIAVTRSIYPPLMQLGPLDLCWYHLVKIELKPAAPDPSNPASAVPLLTPGRR
jgi:hypothetical protein